MRGNEVVIKQLNAALSSELTAIVQYMVQAEMCDNWGYKRLAGFHKKRAIEEMRHAEHLIERLLFLDSIPVTGVALKPQPGKDVKSQLEINLKDELQAIKDYNAASKICREAADNGTRELFEELLKDEERHTDDLEAQLHAIQEIGIATYLTEQLKGE
jgi:bacterioferritin